MDLYRYFHPHHNPRLRNTPIRLQELAELQQAAIELTRALKRAHIRMSRNAPARGSAEQDSALNRAIESADNLVNELVLLSAQYPDDTIATMRQLLDERRGAPGWETWVELLEQRLTLEVAEAHAASLTYEEQVVEPALPLALGVQSRNVKAS